VASCTTVLRAAALAGTALLVPVLPACASRGLPPLYEREHGLPGGLTEDRAVFGIASKTTGPDGARLDALRPLMARVSDGKDAEKDHVIPPFGSHRKNRKGESSEIWPLFFDDVLGTEEEHAKGESDDDTAIFPLLLWGHEPAEGSYFALFPLYGTVKGKLLADRIDFVLFPLYAHTDAGDWHSTHVLWPLIAKGESPTRSHFRVMPFWSQSDSERQSSRTLLWPIGHWGWDKHGDRTFDSWSVFPLVGHRSSRDEQFSEWSFLFPFFEFSHDDRNGDSYVGAPWPFYKHMQRPNEAESTWFWPFYGNYRSRDETSAFYAWPIVWSDDETKNGYTHEHFYVVPLWMQRATTPAGGGPRDEEVRSWPLFDWRRRPDGYETIRVPEIIPVFGWEPGETCYADVVTLFSWRHDKEGRTAWDGPLGAIRYRRDAEGARTLTLLWWIDIPLGGGR
jgi:hypothetical protein